MELQLNYKQLNSNQNWKMTNAIANEKVYLRDSQPNNKMDCL